MTDVGLLFEASGDGRTNVSRSYLVDVVTTPLTVLAGSLWQNPNLPLDTNGDGVISPLDVLMSVNRLNQLGAGPLPALRGDSDAFFDANGDGVHAPADVLVIINYLNSARAAARAEGEGTNIVSSAVAHLSHSIDSANAVLSERPFNKSIPDTPDVSHPGPLEQARIDAGSPAGRPDEGLQRSSLMDHAEDTTFDTLDELLTAIALPRHSNLPR